MATKKQKAYAEQRARGLSRDKSAVLAGYTDKTDDPNTSRIEANPVVKAELARIRAETAANVQITKEEVVQMLIDAAGMAKLMSDPQGIVAAAREIGKMLGFYAPEVKRTLHGLDKSSLKHLLSEMSDEELVKLANAKVIDGTAERVD